MAPNPTELLGSARMKEIVDQLASEYDYVLLDSAPVMPVSDSVVLASLVDGVLVVVGSDTPRQLVLNACTRLRRAKSRIFGIVLNRVNVQNTYYNRYGYYSYKHYDYYRREEPGR